MDPSDFQAASGAEAPEEPTVSEPTPGAPAAPAEPEHELILGKFKSADDLAKSYQHAESKLGELGSKVGELEAKLAQYEQHQPEQPQLELSEQTVSWFDEQAAQNPQAAASWAVQNDPSGVLYHRAMDTWYEIQPRAAANFEWQLQAQSLKAEIAQTLGQTLQPLAKSQAEQNFTAAFQSVKSKFPDLDQHAEQLMAIGNEYPDMLQTLRSGRREDAERVLEGLYAISKMRGASAPAAPAPAPQQQAFVATASSSTAQGEGNTEADEIAAWKQRVFGTPSPMSFALEPR